MFGVLKQNVERILSYVRSTDDMAEDMTDQLMRLRSDVDEIKIWMELRDQDFIDKVKARYNEYVADAIKKHKKVNNVMLGELLHQALEDCMK